MLHQCTPRQLFSRKRVGIDGGLPVPGYEPLDVPKNSALVLVCHPSICLASLRHHHHYCGWISYVDGLTLEQYHAVLHRAHFFTFASALPQTSHFAVLSLSKIALLVLSIASSV